MRAISSSKENGLAQVVGGAEPEAAQLRRQVERAETITTGSSGCGLFSSCSTLRPSSPRQEQIEEHEVVGVALRALEALAAVARPVNRKALRLEPSCEEPEDPRLILDHQDAHCRDHNRAAT